MEKQYGSFQGGGKDPWPEPEVEESDERWVKAEERAADIIALIQPNPSSEKLRNAVTHHLQRLIQNCFSSQVKVFSFGSIPLKTYLPDDDLDVTVFSKNRNLYDTWANEVHDMLKNEERNENAEFQVKEVLFLQAEVKKIRCLVGNLRVNIYFNQLGGICRLCFLHEVDFLINQNHLFKRSVLLIKAWCNFERCILGAHRALISAYALEILVLYLFYANDISSSGPFKVLYCFLDFYSKFDWDKFCISIWGPVAISSLPRVIVKPPQINSGGLRQLLDACYSRYAVYSGGQNRKGQSFRPNFFNVLDPLCFTSNLGSNVCEDNFINICLAFKTGTTSLSRLLNCPKEHLVPNEVDKLFVRTLNAFHRHALTDEQGDILNIDFDSHWKNLQYGRTCPPPHKRKSLKLEEGHIERFDKGEPPENFLYKVVDSIRAVIRGVADLQDKCFKNGATKRKGDNYTLSTWVVEVEEEEKLLNVAKKVKKRGKRKVQEKEYSERRFSGKYKKWGVCRPSEEAKMLIRELIRAVAEHHRKDHLHGALKRLGNVTVKRKYKDDNIEEIRAVEVTLSFKKNNDGLSFMQGVENDISDLSSIIFGKILGGKDIEEYPEDLQDLHDMLQNTSCEKKNLNLIAEHTSLSYWKDKLEFLRGIRGKIKEGSDKEIKRRTEAVLKRVNVSGEQGQEKASGSRRKGHKKRNIAGEESWHSKVPPGPLLKLLNDGNLTKYGHEAKLNNGNLIKYGHEAKDLIRFLRNVIEHVHEARGGRMKYIDHATEAEYEDMQYVEHCINEAFPLLLVELHKGLYSEGVHV